MSSQPTFRPQVEPLESRNLMAVTAKILFNNLFIDGSSGNDYINVTQADGRISVYGTQVTNGVYKTSSVSASIVSRVFVNGYAGNDTIILSTLYKDTVVTAGIGNDMVYGGSANDYLDGGTGDDMLFGGAGNDRLLAGTSTYERNTLLGGTGFDWFYRPFSTSTMFVNGAAYTDVRQGEAPLCQTAAAIAEASRQGHYFVGDIRQYSSTKFDVKLYGNLSTQRVFFDGWTNDQDLVPVAPGEFWTILLQRARLQALRLDPYKENSKASWDYANQLLGGRLYSISEAIYNFTGSYPAFNEMTGANPQTLATAISKGSYIIAQSPNSGFISGDGIIRNHAYAVLNVYLDGSTWKVRLYNPWGMDRETGATIDSLDKYAPAANDGIITLTWSQFTNANNFRGFYTAVKK